MQLRLPGGTPGCTAACCSCCECARWCVMLTGHHVLPPLLQAAVNQTADGKSAVSGLRFLCGDPTCEGGPLPDPASSQPPKNATTTGDWTPWLGRPTLQSTIGICPCPGYILVRVCMGVALDVAAAGADIAVRPSELHLTHRACTVPRPHILWLVS